MLRVNINSIYYKIMMSLIRTINCSECFVQVRCMCYLNQIRNGTLPIFLIE